MKIPLKVRRWLVLTLGWMFILLGIVGLFLPVLQGILFLSIGLVILSSEYVWAHKLLQNIRARFPRLAAHVEKATVRANAWLTRMSASS